MSFHVQLLSIFPEFFDSVLGTGILAKSIERELVSVDRIHIRDFATDKHRTTDDVPYGGGAGMVMKPEPLVGALEHAQSLHPGLPRIYMTPQGQPFDQRLAQELRGAPVDVVLSDMAPDFVGDGVTDHLRQMVLCEHALDFASHVLRPSKGVSR